MELPGLPPRAHVEIGTRAELAGARTRTHLPDGRVLGLVGPAEGLAGWVVDAELDVDPPQALARRFGTDDFWERWTRAECAAKLAGVPVQRWLGRHGLTDPDRLGFALSTVRAESGSLVLSTGRARHRAFTRLP